MGRSLADRVVEEVVNADAVVAEVERQVAHIPWAADVDDMPTFRMRCMKNVYGTLCFARGSVPFA